MHKTTWFNYIIKPSCFIIINYLKNIEKNQKKKYTYIEKTIRL